MTTVVDTSVMIDVLRGESAAVRVLAEARGRGLLHASEISRVEVLAGMRAGEEEATRRLLSVFVWHPLDEANAELAAELGRRWLPGNGGIDAADLVIAATAMSVGGPLLTRNVRHFPMFEGLTTPY